MAICLGVVCLSAAARAQSNAQRINIAVLGLGDGELGRLTTTHLAAKLASSASVSLMDRDLARAAAQGAGYSNSLNLSLAEARDLGAAIGCDFYFIGDAQTVRRSPSTGSPYFESYATLFLVSARTGRLINWERPSFEAPSVVEAERLLQGQLDKSALLESYLQKVNEAQVTERHERELAVEGATPVIEESTGEEKDGHAFRSPRPYRRLKPAYPDSAARADAEGVVDVLVDIDQAGEITHAEIARWAGFGLDEAALDTVRQLHFFPATRNGAAVPIRVLLRYNFRRPAR